MNGTSCFHRILILEISSLRYPITDSRIHTPYAFTCKIYKVSFALSVNSRDSIGLGRPSRFIYLRCKKHLTSTHGQIHIYPITFSTQNILTSLILHLFKCRYFVNDLDLLPETFSFLPVAFVSNHIQRFLSATELLLLPLSHSR